MLLTIDVGNSHIRLGVFEEPSPGAPPRTFEVGTSPLVTSDELALTVRGLLGSCHESLTGIAGLSVVPSVTGEIRRMAERHWPGVPVVVVSPGVKTGVPLNVDNPREVGADRVCNALAAHDLYEGAVIVVDLDTATTIDVVSERGELLGGAIAPGIDISVDALSERAASLRKIEIVRPRTALGKNTVAALQAGIVIGFAGQIDALVDRLRSDVGAARDATVVITGNRAGLVAAESRTVTEIEPDLALEGLRLVFDRNV